DLSQGWMCLSQGYLRVPSYPFLFYLFLLLVYPLSLFPRLALSLYFTLCLPPCLYFSVSLCLSLLPSRSPSALCTSVLIDKPVQVGQHAANQGQCLARWLLPDQSQHYTTQESKGREGDIE